MIPKIEALLRIANYQLYMGNRVSYEWTKYKIRKVIYEYNQQF